MVSQRRFIISSSELNTSFLNPMERICFQICSIGFISGVYGGIERSCIFSGQRNAFDLCHAAPSHTNRIISSGYCSEGFSRNILVHSVSQFGIVKKKPSPLRGSTAPRLSTGCSLRFAGFGLSPYCIICTELAHLLCYLSYHLGFHLFTDFFSQARFFISLCCLPARAYLINTLQNAILFMSE